MMDNYRFLARYNRWFNQRLYACCGGLGDATRKQDSGAFFGSIHRTLNHVLVGDQVWLQRFVQCGADHANAWPALSSAIHLPPGHKLNQPLYDDWATLQARREVLDAAIEAWLASAPPDMAGWTMRYSNTSGTQRQHPMWQALTHFFNHQTHHRGQCHMILTALGKPSITLDLVAFQRVAGQQ